MLRAVGCVTKRSTLRFRCVHITLNLWGDMWTQTRLDIQRSVYLRIVAL